MRLFILLSFLALTGCTVNIHLPSTVTPVTVNGPDITLPEVNQVITEEVLPPVVPAPVIETNQCELQLLDDLNWANSTEMYGYKESNDLVGYSKALRENEKVLLDIIRIIRKQYLDCKG